MLHTWKRIKDAYLFPKYIRDDEKFMIKSSPAGDLMFMTRTINS